MTEKTYKIGEAAEILHLKSYVLRFWETEFTQLAPLRTEKGQRLYTEQDLEVLRRIQHLLHEQGMTIDGARRVLALQERTGEAHASPSTPRPAPQPSAPLQTSPQEAELRRTLIDVRHELLQLRALLAHTHEDTHV